jgi:hypothetical protein
MKIIGDKVNLVQIMFRLSVLLAVGAGAVDLPRHVNRHFTVADDIQWSRFGDPYNAQVDPVTFSPDGLYFVVHTERGVIATNRPQSTLRVYSAEEVRQFLLHPEMQTQPSPTWVIRRSTYKDGPIITHIRWLADSSEFSFLAKSALGSEQLFLADLKSKTITALTSQDQSVLQFDVRGRDRFVYCILSPTIHDTANQESHKAGVVGTGRSLGSLMFTADTTYGQVSSWYDLGELWAVVDGHRFRVNYEASDRPLPLHWSGETMSAAGGSLALSPDGNSAIAIMAVSDIPTDWQELYPPPDPSSAIQIRTSGPQDLWALDGFLYASEYVLIDLKTGGMTPLTNAPTGYSTSNWGSLETAAWSHDGRSILLSNSFLPLDIQGSHVHPNPPCVAVIDVEPRHLTCLERIEGGTYKEGAQEFITGAAFTSDGSHEITVSYLLRDGTRGSSRYSQAKNGSWSASETSFPLDQARAIDVMIKEDLNNPPLLMAVDILSKRSRVLLDPNPQFKDIDLGEASVLTWTDKLGRVWKGGLYKPPGYIAGQRYPLVVQTHGFDEHQFRPSGTWPTGGAARALAAVGIVVLQAPDCPIFETPEEGPCNVGVYESGVEKLVSDGLVDAKRVGITGFSRTCFDVLETLTTGRTHFEAASVTDGFNMGYMEYLHDVDYGNNFDLHTIEAALGVGPPFGKELNEWISRAPAFNMNKVYTPIQVVATNKHESLLEMWEPYAALRLLHRPVDLIILGQGTHPLTNPAQLMLSQGGVVDWFDFWLNGNEDPDPAKTEQYRRWRELRKLQEKGLGNAPIN